jgi:hypothetical protein
MSEKPRLETDLQALLKIAQIKLGYLFVFKQ